MITTGGDYGGPELQGSPIQSALSISMRALRDLRDPNYQNGERPWVNPVYIVPGSISKPDFEGMQLGHYSKKQKGLVVMIAVPQAVADGVGMHEFIVQSLRDACEMAANFFAGKGEIFHLLGAQSLINKVDQRLQQTA